MEQSIDFIIYGNAASSLIWAYLFDKTGRRLFALNAVLHLVVSVLWLLLSRNMGGLT